jgi:selenocysteine lyase/cysteine desulfurase
MLGVAALKIQAAREKLAAYVHAHKQDLALVENCTAATTSAVRAAGVRAGDTVVHLSTGYGMVKNCLAHAAAAVGAEVREVCVEFNGHGSEPCGAGGRPLAVALAATLDEAGRRGSRVALVSFDYIASCPGALMPVHALARACKSRGVPVLLDGAHVLGQIHVDCHALEASGVTYFMADAHKWLFSPKGSAMLWVVRAAQVNVFPSVVGAVCSNSPTTNFSPAALAGLSEFERRFQYTGTRDYTPLIAVRDALLFRERVGEAAILGYNHGMAVWAQDWLAAVWRTETLVPPNCTGFMAHARVPLRSPAAALLMNRILKEDHAIHVMAFSLPARKHLGESQPSHWVRPCIQLFVHREDIRALGTAVLRLAVGVEAAAKLGSHWLAKTRETTAAKRAAVEVDAANFLDATAAHKVTVGFSVSSAATAAVAVTSGGGSTMGEQSGASAAAASSGTGISTFARKDSARDFTQPASVVSGFALKSEVVEAVDGEEKQEEVAEEVDGCSSVERGRGGFAAAVAKYSAAQQVHGPHLCHHTGSSFGLPALPEGEQAAAEVTDAFNEVDLRSGSIDHGVDFSANFVAVNKGSSGAGNGGVGGSNFALSPTSILDLGSSVASSMGTSVDGAGFLHPDWLNGRKVPPGLAHQHPQQPRQGF